jgi:hypothetical protein
VAYKAQRGKDVAKLSCSTRVTELKALTISDYLYIFDKLTWRGVDQLFCQRAFYYPLNFRLRITTWRLLALY